MISSSSQFDQFELRRKKFGHFMTDGKSVSVEWGVKFLTKPKVQI